MSRLTEEMVIARAKQSDLSMIKKLNCWGSDLSDVSIIKRMRGVEVLALSVNKISTLSPFEECHKLQELYLRKNNITDINEIAYLQNLPSLRYLWLEENPCCDLTNNYRSVVLRALPNLKKLDNVEVTQEEVDEALRGGGGSGGAVTEEELYEDAYQQQQQQQTSRTSPQQMPQQQQQHSYPQHSPPTQQQQYPQQPPQQQQSQQLQRRSSSPLKEPPLPSPHLASPLANNSSEGTITTHSASDLYGSQIVGSKPPTPTKEPLHPPSPMYNNLTKEQRTYQHQYDRSPGSDQESSPQPGFSVVRPTPLPPSTSTHSMKEYYQSDRPAGYPAHYRHSQTDLTEWDEHHQAPQVHHNPYGSQMQLHHPPTQRRSEPAYRNGNARENGGEWDSDERPRSRRPEGRFSDSTATLSASVMNHYTGFHRRPVNRSSNLLSATLCLVKELDYASLEVLEHAVRCRIEEIANE